jgi:small subunit ribosomal protein S20
MPNMKNAIKKVKGDKKKAILNNEFSASVKSAIKDLNKAVTAGDKKKAGETLKIALKRVDKEHAAGVTKKETVARRKSRLMKKVNAMK